MFTYISSVEVLSIHKIATLKIIRTIASINSATTLLVKEGKVKAKKMFLKRLFDPLI